MIMPIKIKNKETAEALADSKTAKTPEPEKTNIIMEQPPIVRKNVKAKGDDGQGQEQKPSTLNLLHRVRYRK